MEEAGALQLTEAVATDIERMWRRPFRVAWPAEIRHLLLRLVDADPKRSY